MNGFHKSAASTWNRGHSKNLLLTALAWEVSGTRRHAISVTSIIQLGALGAERTVASV